MNDFVFYQQLLTLEIEITFGLSIIREPLLQEDDLGEHSKMSIKLLEHEMKTFWKMSERFKD